METGIFTLAGKHIRLEPLDRHHLDSLVKAAAEHPSLYQWTIVPRNTEEMTHYIDAALASRENGSAVPFATVRQSDGAVIGSTRFCYLERWAWPAEHPRQGNVHPDCCEIGFTWLAHSAIRTAANTEAKLLMLTHAFETWKVLRVCFHTDARNTRSATALERIGATFEGILRAHRISPEATPRDSKRYSILAAEWPDIKQELVRMLKRD